MELPLERVVKKLTEVRILKNNIPLPRFLWLHNSKDQIIALYNSVYRGYINYYSFAHNLGESSSYIHSVLRSSCAKLLAAKLTLSSQYKVFEKFGKDLKGEDNISFVKPLYKKNVWDFKGPALHKTGDVVNNGLIQTLYAESISTASLENLTCSLCQSKHRVEMHHVRHMKDLNPKLNKIDALMVKRRRKQIPLCRNCHLKHHSKQLTLSPPKSTGEPYDGKLSRTVRERDGTVRSAYSTTIQTINRENASKVKSRSDKPHYLRWRPTLVDENHTDDIILVHSHVGFILLGLSIHTVESTQAFMFYLIQYSMSNLNAFILIITIGYSLYSYVYDGNIIRSIEKSETIKQGTITDIEKENTSKKGTISSIEEQSTSNKETYK